MISSSAFAGIGDSTKAVRYPVLERSLQSLSVSPKPAPQTGGTFDLKPTFGLGIGTFTFLGDISSNHDGFDPWVSRIGYQIGFSHPLNSWLSLEFNALYGKMSANERDGLRNENFETRIRAGGVYLTYNFDHVLPERPKRVAEPFISLGFESFEFLSKTDKYDAFGNEYHYWSDGSIMNLPENHPDADDAVRIFRDYTYETDLREQNLDSLGKYPERSWAFPVAIGANFYIAENFKFRISSSLHFTTTDLIDNITGESGGVRQGNSGNDKFLFTSFSLTYDLQIIKKETDIKEDIPEPWEEPLFAMVDTFDSDFDEIKDFQDICPNTPPGVEVDERGCPFDDDGDGVPNYMDLEADTPSDNFADEQGVSLTDEYLDSYWDRYYDSTGKYNDRYDSSRTIAYSDGTHQDFSKPETTDDAKEIVIILDKKMINVRANDLYKYLGYREFKTVTKNDTVYYVIGGFENLEDAQATLGALKEEGVVTQGVGESSTTSMGETVITTVDPEKLPDGSQGEAQEVTSNGEIIYRVQVAAYARPPNDPDLQALPNLVQFKGADGLTRYFSGSFNSLEDASKHKIDIAYEEGYSDAFVVAFQDGKRISLRQVTQVRDDYEENIEAFESSINDGIDKDQIKYRLQLGEFKGDIPTDLLDLYLNLQSEVGKFTTKKMPDGSIKYLAGEFESAGDAETMKKLVQQRGVDGAMVVGDYMGRIMSLEEVIELLKE